MDEWTRSQFLLPLSLSPRAMHPGAMDDAASTAVMLEIVRAMAYRPMPPNRAVIFCTRARSLTISSVAQC